MNRWGCLVASLAMLIAGAAVAQPVIGPYDIPATPGQTADFYIEEGGLDGVPVNLGPSGANRFYNFTAGPTDNLMTEEIVEPEDSPYYDTFPTANRVSIGPAPFGISDAASWRYDRITLNNWTTLGLVVEIEGTEFPFELPQPLQIAPLPLNYGDDWEQTISEVLVLSTDILPVDIPFDSVQVEINIGQFSEVDGWGQAAIPGGIAPVLRVHSNAGGVVEAWGVVYIFNIRILIPLGEIFSLDATQAYTWYSPGLGEIASITSLPGEQDPDFAQASNVRRRALLGDEAMAMINAAPQGGEPVIPGDGGSFLYDVTLQTTINSAAQADAWASVVLPDGSETTVQLVPLTLPPNADIQVNDLELAVPASAPAGNYEFRVNLGIHPAVVVARDSFPFTVAADGPRTAGEPNDGWAAFGLDRLAARTAPADIAADDEHAAVTPDRFVLAPVYPNPFNAAATVSLTLPDATELQVRVLNTLGREVATLASGRHAAGEHRFSLHAGNLPSGLYLIEANAAGYGSRVTKAVVVK